MKKLVVAALVFLAAMAATSSVHAEGDAPVCEDGYYYDDEAFDCLPVVEETSTQQPEPTGTSIPDPGEQPLPDACEEGFIYFDFDCRAYFDKGVEDCPDGWVETIGLEDQPICLEYPGMTEPEPTYSPEPKPEPEIPTYEQPAQEWEPQVESEAVVVTSLPNTGTSGYSTEFPWMSGLAALGSLLALAAGAKLKSR